MSELPREWMRGPQYAGEPARKEWAGVIRSAQQAWSTIELVTVSEGLRPSARVDLEPSEMPTASRDAASVGLILTPLSWTGRFVRCAVSAPGFVRAWHAANAESNDELIGQLLGFPQCCRDAFQKLWIERRVRDQAPFCNAFEGPWETNILFRHIGVRLVPHLPCSGTCAETIQQARAFADAGRKCGADVDSIERVLRLGASYDALNGVAILDAGPWRIMHSTDAAPFRAARPATPGAPVPAAASTPWEDNGFDTRHSMDSSHDVVARLLPAGSVASVIDLGAGDGTLLARVAGRERNVAVEMDVDRALRGQERHPGFEFWTGRMETYLVGAHGQPFDVALLMPGRLLELDEAARRLALARLAQTAKRVLIYAYGDWLTRHKGLAALATAAGLRVWGGVVVGADGAAQAAWAEVA